MGLEGGCVERNLPGSGDGLGQRRSGSSAQADLLPLLRHGLFHGPIPRLAGKAEEEPGAGEEEERRHRRPCRGEAFDCQPRQRGSAVGWTRQDQAW